MSEKTYERTDNELKALSPDEAREKLTDEEIERYNELKKDELEENIETQRQKEQKQAGEAISALIDSTKNELTETVDFNGAELEVYIDPDIEDFKKLGKAFQYGDKKPEELPAEELQELEDNLLDLLAKTTVNFDREDWNKKFADAGFRTKANVAQKIFDQVDIEMEQKKSR